MKRRSPFLATTYWSCVVLAVSALSIAAAGSNSAHSAPAPVPAAHPATAAPPAAARPAVPAGRTIAGGVQARPVPAVRATPVPTTVGRPAVAPMSRVPASATAPHAQRGGQSPPFFGSPQSPGLSANRSAQPQQLPSHYSQAATPPHPAGGAVGGDFRRTASSGRVRLPMSALMSQCSHAPRAPGACGVWGGFGGVAEQNRLRNATRAALRSGAGTATWTGTDGVARQVAFVAGPPQYMTVTFITGPGAYVVPGQDFDIQDLPPPPLPDSPSQPLIDGGGGISRGATPPTPQPTTPPGTSNGVGPDTGNRQDTATAKPAPPGSALGKGPGLDADSDAPKSRICRPVKGSAVVGTAHDDAAELWCRNEDGDWAPAMLAAGAG
jgi:hypothetical protein